MGERLKIASWCALAVLLVVASWDAWQRGRRRGRRVNVKSAVIGILEALPLVSRAAGALGDALSRKKPKPIAFGRKHIWREDRSPVDCVYCEGVLAKDESNRDALCEGPPMTKHR